MSDIDDYFDDEIDVAAFDAVVTAASSIPSTHRPVVGGSSSNAYTQKKFIQPTIFGASQVPTKAEHSSSQYQPPVPKSTQQVPKVKAVKKWDRLSAVKALPDVLRSAKKNKKKARAGDASDEEEVQDEDEDDLDSDTDLLLKALRTQDDSTQQQHIAMKLEFDPEAIRKWIYSINKPKRKYQYDIVARALFNNCLVSLPTGLGKTFIAAVVMLKCEIEACHSIAGIPSIDCASLTGTISANKRAEAWAQKRVIFATPQTVANDLRRGSLRPQDVICVVVDEAHRATGAYAYCIVVRLLMRFNPHFRVLALTATPGSDPERVQCVIDNLHIGHIEVRTEESMDIKPYTKNKEIILEKIPLTADLMTIRDQWGKLMLPLIKQCGSLFHGSKDPAYIHAFSITSAQINVPKERSYLRPNLTVLSKMATAMGKLLEYSIPLAYEKMKELKSEPNKCARGVCSQVGYKTLMEEIETLTKSPGFVPHPKMEKMKALTIDFFVNAQDVGKSSRVMIFCHFRDMVTDIVSYLNQERPLIKASPFIGQSNDVRGNRGMNQKTQNSVIQQFKNEEFNVLVATSIGEEGLDIGALDFIICYEAQKSPLRMLQRLGRTGRNEDGKVIVLIAEGREDKNWEKAQDQYQHVQNALLSRKVLELYEDCERLVPEGVRPVPMDEKIDVQPYIAEQVEIELASNKSKKGKGGAKRKRPGLEDIPAGAIFGFVGAKDYKIPKSKAEALRERAENALLNAEEAAILKQQWASDATSANIQPPIDPNDMDIVYFPTKTPLGSRLGAVAPNKRLGRNVTRSYGYANIIRQCGEFVADEEKCEAWRSAQMDRWNEKNVVLWSSEMRGKGPRRPIRLCAEGARSITRRWQISETVCNKTEPTTDSFAGYHHQTIPVSPSEHGPSSPSKVCNESKESHPSQSDLPEADELICSRRAAEHSSSPLRPPKLGTVATAPKSSARPEVTAGLDKSSGHHRLAAFQNTACAPAPFEPNGNTSSGFQRLSAFKNAAPQPAPYAPVLKPGVANASSSRPTNSLNQPLNLPREYQSHDRHQDAASDSSVIETIPDSETEGKPPKLFLSSPAQTPDDPCKRLQDEGTSANTSFCRVVPDSEETSSKQQCHKPDDLPMDAIFDSEAQFEELDLEDLQALDRLEKDFNQQNPKPILPEPQAEANQPVPSSPSDHFSELDMEALAALDEAESRTLENHSVGQGSHIRRSPVTPNPNVHSSHRPFAKMSSLTSRAYDHSPLLFRSLGQKLSQKPVIGANEPDDGDSFLDPATVMVATQMPFNKRIPRIMSKGNQSKRIIAELSEEEEEEAEDGDGDQEKVGKAGKKNAPPMQPKLQNQSKGKQKMIGRPRRDNEWAMKTGFELTAPRLTSFDMEAMGSGSSVSEEGEEGVGAGPRKKRKKPRQGKKKKRRASPSSESIESENSIDRDFLVNTSSSNIRDNCSPDKSMTSFYRASILMMSQPLSVVKKKLKGPATLPTPQPTRNNSNSNRNSHNWKNQSRSDHLPKQASTSRHRQDKSSDDKFINSNEDNDHFSFDSFCVPDEETVEYEDTQLDTTLDTSEI